jgi:hypothetical protein
MRTALFLAALTACRHHEWNDTDTVPVPGDTEALFADTVVGLDAALPAVTVDGAILGIVGLGDVDGDGTDDVAVQLADHAEVWRGSELVAGASAPWLVFDGATGIASAGDVDGDGLADVLAGSEDAWALHPGGGAAFATFTPGSGRRMRAMAAGDVDGDGVPDLVGTEYVPDTGRAHEEVYVAPGVALTAGSHPLEDGEGAYGAVVDDDGSGPASVALVDVDGDGLDDIATGAVRNFAAFHLGDSVGGSTGLSDQEIHLHTCHPDEACPNGTTVGSAGDVDGDGVPDLLVAAFPTGTSFVIPGAALAADAYHTQWVGGTLATERAIDGAGPLVGIGDVDGIGFADVLASDGTVAYLLFGHQIANQAAVSVDVAVHRFEGFAADGALVIGAPGDVDGDGMPDFALADANGTLRIVLNPR